MSRASHLWLVLAVVVCGCQSYPFVRRPNQRVARTRINEVVLSSSNTDVLFVIDNSGSMKEEQDNLKRNTAQFIEELTGSGNNYRVGIVSTDVFKVSQQGNLLLEPASGCSIATDYLDAPDPESQDFEQERNCLVETFKATVESLGITGSGREAGLLAAQLAVDPLHALNPDFLRPEADLALIFLSDEDDCSFDDFKGIGGEECYTLIDQTKPVADTVDFFADLKGSITKVRAAAIAGGVRGGQEVSDFLPSGCRLGVEGSAECGCWFGLNDVFYCELLEGFGHPCDTHVPCDKTTCAPNGSDCNMQRCDALPGTRYHDFVRELRVRRLRQRFPAGTFEDSICRNEYGETLEKIAQTVVLSDCFKLIEPASDEGLIELTLERVDEHGVNQKRIVKSLSEEGSEVCADCGACPEGAWQLVDSSTICLECGLRKQAGDAFSLAVINEVTDAWVGD